MWKVFWKTGQAGGLVVGVRAGGRVANMNKFVLQSGQRGNA